MSQSLQRTSPKTGQLIAEVVAVSALRASAKLAMWRVFARYYADISQEKFERDLTKKNDVIVLMDSGDRSIQGFSTLEVYDRELEGRKFRAIFSGDTIIEEAYWGQRALQRTFVRYVIAQKLARPLTPVYWFLISKGYKTYLLLSRNYTTYWPRHDKATPSWERTLIGHLATDKYGSSYRPATGVLRFEAREGRLKDGVAPVDPEALTHPDIRFFLQRNPGHVDGDELCCVGKVDMGLWTKFTGRLMTKAVTQTTRTARRIWAVATTAF